MGVKNLLDNLRRGEEESNIKGLLIDKLIIELI